MLKLKSYSELLLVVLIILTGISLVRNIKRDISAKKRISEEQTAIEKLEAENNKLAEKLKYELSDEYIEYQLRDKLGFVKEGETLVVLPDEETMKKLTYKKKEKEDTLPPPNWKKWAQIFEIPI